jgi:hypothetical protein
MNIFRRKPRIGNADHPTPGPTPAAVVRDVAWLDKFNSTRPEHARLTMDDLFEIRLARQRQAWGFTHMSDSILDRIESEFTAAKGAADSEVTSVTKLLAHYVGDASETRRLADAAARRRQALVDDALARRDAALLEVRADVAELAEQRRAGYAGLRHQARTSAHPAVTPEQQAQASALVAQARDLRDLERIHADALQVDDKLAYCVEQAATSHLEADDLAMWNATRFEQARRRAAAPLAALERSEAEITALVAQVGAHLTTQEATDQADLLPGRADRAQAIEAGLTTGAAMWSVGRADVSV